MNRSRFLSAALLLSLLAIGFLFAFPEAFVLHRLEEAHASDISYDSTIPQHEPYEILGRADNSTSALEVDPSTGLVRDLKVRRFQITMMLNAKANLGYADVFQTAPGNSGLRLELFANTLALISASTASGGVKTIVLSSDFALNEPHALQLTIDRTNHLVIILDGHVVSDAALPELSYMISDVVIGSGFSKLRPFVGRIGDASVAYEIYRIDPNGEALNRDFRAFLFIVVVTAIYFLIGPERKASIHWPWLTSPSWFARASSSLASPSEHLPAFAVVRRYVWPLPGDSAGELLLDRQTVTFRALDHLAGQLEQLAITMPASRSSEALLEFEWKLPDNIGATIRLTSRNGAVGDALGRLAHHIRELAGFVEA